MDSGTRITGGGSGYAAILAHAGGALYGMELGSVSLKRIGFFCFPIKHSTHTARGRSSVWYGTRLGDLKEKVRPGRTRLGDLEESWFIFVFRLNTQHTHNRHWQDGRARRSGRTRSTP